MSSRSELLVEYDWTALADMNIRGDLYMYTRDYGPWDEVHLVMPRTSASR